MCDNRFFDELGSLTHLPGYVYQPPLIESIIDRWKDNPLVKKVLAGETTFVQEFKPLFEAYQSANCYSPEFAHLASEIEGKFDGIACLLKFHSSGNWAMRPISNPRKWFLLRYGYFVPSQFWSRRLWAETILSECRETDEILESFVT